MGTVKSTNPKDAVGVCKSYQSVIPRPVLHELGLAMLEGALKYGRHNYRVSGVRASVYFDAVYRHLDAFWEGEDIDPEALGEDGEYEDSGHSGLSHVVKAIACLVVLRDSMIQGNWTDDRPPKSPTGWLDRINAMAATLVDQYPDPKPAHVHEPGVQEPEKGLPIKVRDRKWEVGDKLVYRGVLYTVHIVDREDPELLLLIAALGKLSIWLHANDTVEPTAQEPMAPEPDLEHPARLLAGDLNDEYLGLRFRIVHRYLEDTHQPCDAEGKFFTYQGRDLHGDLIVNGRLIGRNSVLEYAG